MRLPIGWLEVFTPLEALGLTDPLRAHSEGVRALVGTLDSLGLVVEGVEEHPVAADGVVTAKVLAIHRIEGADRIRLVEVDDGSGRIRPVVCGAWNFVEGDVVPLALPGVRLPNGAEIGARRLRGVTSEGMLCSAPEAGLGSDASGLAILSPSLPLGVPVREALGVRDEVVLDIAVEPNRPDASGVRGVARDLAARFRAPFVDVTGVLTRQDPRAVTVEEGAVDRLVLASLEVRGAVLEPRVARWLVLSGMRQISPIVDATNAVMLETGQPSHAYDRDRLAGGVVGVRSARPGERLVTLDDRERTLAGGELVIVDGSDRAVGLAGIMGGAETEVNAETEQVLLEVAAFPRERIARAARATGLRTEASWRFERGVDPAVAHAVCARVAALVGVATPMLVADVAYATTPRRIAVRAESAVAIAGDPVVLESFEPDAGLSRLGFDLEPDGDGWQVGVPTWRPDVTDVADVVEEALRQVGYDAVAPTPLIGPRRDGPTLRQQRERALSTLLADEGAFEAWSVTMVSPSVEEQLGSERVAPVIANPLRPEESVLRTTVAAGLVGALDHAVRRRLEPARFFEWGPVFWQEGRVVNERQRLGLIVAHAHDGGVEAGRWLARLVARAGLELGPGSVQLGPGGPGWPRLHPSRQAAVIDDGLVVGVFGELAPDVAAALGARRWRYGVVELDADWLAEPRPLTASSTLGAFAASELDLSFEVPWDLAAASLAARVREEIGPVVRDVAAFDTFVREGRRSLGLRLRLEDPEGPISEARVREVIEVARHAGAALGAALRTAPAS
ncbi:phenylalanyl-tRNA synthetase, beta subunit [Acidimicrobium ferrooxidans DSM 10331]|uniref:Phenylalanine--tRNA ligase beta subunit n=1 Tax=Acidimicrobium ferrooxidans (strain DSM 10331 / JCM 15462 / NBRC 103882 / ICP) TaxID=525909 RepID=C7M0T1_ACIFD|nr:phenylalanine--tRNA ligase subunit beta [Acidimicrobium ferrooxidans]ACU54589.1 phenylalanyl-tRNA synthetase, beta subunit [Acidimicrobium ferrooxidans DSM 10331]